MYLTFVSMTIFGLWVSLTWDIPVDNQIAMFILSCMCVCIILFMLIYDIRTHIKGKMKPQRF